MPEANGNRSKSQAAAQAFDPEQMSLGQIQEFLKVGIDGLSQTEAEGRLQQYGPNELAEKKVSPLLRLLSFFWGPMPWMIEIAALLSSGKALG
jgi:H+-transporting ATPase